MLAIIQCRILSSSLLPKNRKITTDRTTVLPVVLYGVKLGRSHRENNVLRRISGPKRDEVTIEKAT
jgi:hypothetical protein